MFRAIARSSRGVWRNTQNARVVPIASQPWRDFHVPGQHRKLGDVVHLDLLVNESTNRIIEIWRQYHAAKKDTVAAGMPTNKWDMFKQRTQESPMFVIPIARGDGYLTLVVQHHENSCLITDLESYTRWKHAAPPFLVLNHYDDFQHDKGLVLMRGDVDLTKMTQIEAKLVSSLMHTYYLQQEKYVKFVHRFNKQPREKATRGG
eukprot:TRINITY_DN1263_c0_g1_i7.p1 TRINITY_DN1263_c0_g1~~TRINITY_DN1263_c0_g1_i7.p1  ORF type:complete len:204 (+),score=27.81 TRINITY_DN1263_c0_g1_i7:166-777(+)